MDKKLIDKLQSFGVIPVIAVESVDTARSLARALIAGGLPVAEITFRTAAAADVIQMLSKEFPEIMVGAGTILTVENLERAIKAGATFGVAPGFNPAIVRKAAELGLPFMPGVATPTEIEAALSAGCKALKFFPAGEMGGVKMLKALSAPYKHTGVRFMPTGGVKPDNLAEYLAVDTVMVCGGTWVATKDAMAAGNWEAITTACRDAVACVRKARETGK